ncbi:MAG: glycosyltransferase [Methanobacteriaceae archaeon]|nr:glycosyltransferase [Methanobacteriaceae archaeon]
MKIIQTPVRFYPFIGGVESYVYYISRELAKLDCNVKVICANEPNSIYEETYNGIKIKRLHYITKVANTNITPALPTTLLKEDYDIIHTHIPTPWSADWSNIISTIKNKPLILTYHNNIIATGKEDKIAQFYNNTALKLLLKKAKKIIITQDNYINSPHLQKYKQKTITIPNGVDTEKFKPQKEKTQKNTIFFLSVLDKYHKYKGLDYLLNAIKETKKTIPDVKLIIGGKGELTQYYKDKAKKLGIKENTDFIGFIPEEKITDYYNMAEIFILPSISKEQEGFGIVLLEAQSCQKPVITTNIVGIAQDIQKEETGIVIKPKDTKALTQAIKELLLNKEKAEEMGKKGRQIVKKHYEWKKIAEQIKEVYEEII